MKLSNVTVGKTLINRLVNAQDMENRHALLLEEIEESLDPAKVAVSILLRFTS